MRFSPDIFVQQAAGGISRYFSELHLGLLRADVDSVAFTGPAGHLYLDGAPQVHRLPWRGHGRRGDLARAASFAVSLLRSPGKAIYHPTYYTARTIPRRPSVCTFYDLIHFKKLANGADRASVIEGQRRWAKAADLVLAISQTTAADLTEAYGVSPSKIRVTPLAVGIPSTEKASRRPTGAPDAPYTLFVGQRGGYKNWAAVVQAIAQPDLRGLHLVCAGGGGFSADERELLVRTKTADRVHQLSPDDASLDQLYKHAVCLTYPSLYEGFGLPPLEAMVRGVPVVTSDRGSLPEVVADAALVCSPDSDAIAEALLRVLRPDVAADLVRRGHERAQEFSWDKTVERTVSAYRELTG